MSEREGQTLDEIFREYAWSYFELHAEQRLKTFHFFIILATTVVGGFLLLFRFGEYHKWSALLGLLLTLLSFVFWKLELRTRALVKHGEEALKFLDAQHELPDIDGVPHPLRIFSREEHVTIQLERSASFPGHFSYSRCFKYIFVVFGVLGLGAALVCGIFLPV